MSIEIEGGSVEVTSRSVHKVRRVLVRVRLGEDTTSFQSDLQIFLKPNEARALAKAIAKET